VFASPIYSFGAAIERMRIGEAHANVVA
jgi:hypothetical protein